MENLEMPKLAPQAPAPFRKPAVSLGVPLERESKAALRVAEPLAKLHRAWAVSVP